MAETKTSDLMMPSGWHVDEDTGAWVRDTIHRMGRRCRNWDYCGKACYQVTLVLADRKNALFGELRFDAENGAAYVALTALGAAIEALARRFAEFTPEIEALGVRVMPDHLHLVLRVARRLPARKPLGIALRGFKGGATKLYWKHLGFSAESQPSTGAAVAPGLKSPGPLFAEGFVDTILSDEAAVAHELAYLADNPRRLWEKRTHPELFRVLRDLPLALFSASATAHFAAIGNHDLLHARLILQVQCSRRYFAYARDAKGNLLKDATPAVCSPEFVEKRDALIAAASHGAVLVSPCISEGEREIARLAFAAGHRVITLANKGFSPLYKPGGKLFDTCAAGNLLMLAPAGWPYLPGEKKMTREDACILNFLASEIAGEGAVEIVYKGMVPAQVEQMARMAVKVEERK